MLIDIFDVSSSPPSTYPHPTLAEVFYAKYKPALRAHASIKAGLNARLSSRAPSKVRLRKKNHKEGQYFRRKNIFVVFFSMEVISTERKKNF